MLDGGDGSTQSSLPFPFFLSEDVVNEACNGWHLSLVPPPLRLLLVWLVATKLRVLCRPESTITFLKALLAWRASMIILTQAPRWVYGCNAASIPSSFSIQVYPRLNQGVPPATPIQAVPTEAWAVSWTHAWCTPTLFLLKVHLMRPSMDGISLDGFQNATGVFV